MKLGPLEIGHWTGSQELTTLGRLEEKALPPLAPLSRQSSFFPYIMEPFIGAWQSNVSVTLEDVTSHPTAWACITLIASDIAKNCVRLVEEDDDGIWNVVEASSPFWPVLRKPNSYQTRIEFFEAWMISKLTRGNTYVLKERQDLRGIVTAMHVLDPSRVTPLVAPDGAVYYQVKKDDLSGIRDDQMFFPASEIVHDRMPTLYHPLVGVSPILHAAGVAAVQGLKIQSTQTNLFSKGAAPGGIITAPLHIPPEAAARVKAQVDGYASSGDRVGEVMILGDGMTFTNTHMTAVDTELIKQLDWSDKKICSVYHVPTYMVGVTEHPPYNNVEAQARVYYQQCLQIHFEKIELLLDEGLGIEKAGKGTEFDLDNLLRMDSATMMSTLKEGVGAAILTPDEARLKLNYAPVAGGNTPYMQEQNWPLRLLSQRELPTRTPTEPAPVPVPSVDTPDTAGDDSEDDDAVKFLAAMHQKSIDEGLYAA